MNGGDGGIRDGLRHGSATETVTGGVIGKYGDLQGRRVQAGKFQTCVFLGLGAVIAGKCVGVFGFEIGPDRSAAPVALDDDETSGLAQADGWRQAGVADQQFRRAFR